MREFHSYGPVDCEDHFCISREELVDRCTGQLIGKPAKGGHYFTIWAPRQTGKTWLTLQVKKEIEARYGDRFLVGSMSVQGVVIKDEEPEEAFLTMLPLLLRETFDLEIDEAPRNWQGLMSLFARKDGLFDRPVVLFIDEFDSLPVRIIDLLVGLFRDMYQKRHYYLLHGLALIGVRAVLGVTSDRGSPFNIQRSLHIPNLTMEEVENLYDQYQEESGQPIKSDVVNNVFKTTNGQPGLVSWFGELLTEKCNPGPGRAIDMDAWRQVWLDARTVEPNNNLINLIAKARKPEYRGFLARLFSAADEPFLFHDSTHNYLYMHGVIAPEKASGPDGATIRVCKFASPFIQRCLYDALGRDLIGAGTPILALDPLDDLEDVFGGPELNIPSLLNRYKDYLARLKNKGLDPWRDSLRRSDMHNMGITEAVGHFHLYAWLKEAVEDQCAVHPEFPTGNGKVDLHLKCGDKRGVIEVKSFKNLSRAKAARKQAARYAQDLALSTVTIAMFTPSFEEVVLEKLSMTEIIDGITITVVAIGWP